MKSLGALSVAPLLLLLAYCHLAELSSSNQVNKLHIPIFAKHLGGGIGSAVYQFSADGENYAVKLARKEAIESELRALKLVRSSCPQAHRYFAFPSPGFSEPVKARLCWRRRAYPGIVFPLFDSSLHRYLRHHRPSDLLSLHLMVQISEAVGALHEARISHGDLCLDNILCNFNRGRPIAVVADMESCWSHGEEPSKIWRPGWVPVLEFSLGLRGPHSDVYALGVMLKLLFWRNRGFLFPSSTVEGMDELIRRCSYGCFNRLRRPSASEVAKELRAMLARHK
jgi:serine/threonine protein kinase